MKSYYQIKYETDIEYFHQKANDCVDGCIVGFTYVTKTCLIEDGIYFDDNREQLKVVLEGGVRVELVFCGVRSIHYDINNDDEIIYALNLQIKNGLIYFSTDDCSDIDTWNEIGLSVTAKEMFWKII